MVGNLTTLLSSFKVFGVDDRGRQVYEIVRLVRPMTLNSGRIVESELRHLGLTVGMRGVLEVVAEHGPLTVPAIARTLDVSRQATQRLVNELESAGLARMAPNPRHQRSSLVELTPSGSTTFDAVRAREMEQLAELAPDLPDGHLQIARQVMVALADGIRDRAYEIRGSVAGAQDTDHG